MGLSVKSIFLFQITMPKGIYQHYKKEKSPTWKGGKLLYWKKIAKIRDDYTCQICGFRDPEIMEVDHVKQRKMHPELLDSLENLMTLCPNCHRRKSNRELKNRIWKK